MYIPKRTPAIKTNVIAILKYNKRRHFIYFLRRFKYIFLRYELYEQCCMQNVLLAKLSFLAGTYIVIKLRHVPRKGRGNFRSAVCVWDRQIVYMANHGCGRGSVVNPGNKLWRPPVEVTQFWARGAVLAPVFCKTKKNYMEQEAGEQYEIKVVRNNSSYCLATY